MNKFWLLPVAFSLSCPAAYADENPVDMALKKLDSDNAKFQLDLSKNADKETLITDKRNIKADRAAVKTARRNEMDWFAKHQSSSN